MNEKTIKRVQSQIGYEFKNVSLLEQAFTRRSFSAENGGNNNEVLEFIGDKVLDIAVVRYLTNRYGNYPESSGEEYDADLSEGDLTKLKQKMVQKGALAQRIEELDLAQYLKTGKGDKRKGGDYSDSVKEDLFEALLGAVAIDCNWNFKELQDVVETMLCPDSFIEDDGDDDYVSLIYEWCNRRYGHNPTIEIHTRTYSQGLYGMSPNTGFYSLVDTVYNNGFGSFSNVNPYTLQGMPQHAINSPSSNQEHKIQFKACVLHIDNLDPFNGSGATSYEAKKEACKEAYKYLDNNNMLFTIQDEIDNPNIDDAINQLETLARRGYFSLPEYEFEESHDENGNPIWRAECHIEEEEYYYYADESSKKQAKKQAAYDMLMHVLGYEEE